MVKLIAHHFIGGVYFREMEIPEDFEVVTHKHNYDHASVLTQGCVIVEADGQQQTYWSPAIIEIKAGVAHSIRTVNGPAHWLCVHRTDCDDENKVDEVLIQKTRHMKKLALTVPVARLNEELETHKDLWNLYNLRTCAVDSPHREVDDIWLRYRRQSEFDPDHPEEFSSEHESVWYDAYYQLPAVEWILAQIQAHLGDFELGGVLITRIKPGASVKPHIDTGWHAEYYKNKYLVLLESAPGQTFNYETESHSGCAGDVFEFNNQEKHWVINDSDKPRVSLIFACRKKH